MAAITDAMQWYTAGGTGQTVRPKYLFTVEIFSRTLMAEGRELFSTIRTIELPKYSIEIESVNAWNVRQHVTTKINYEPITITLNDTTDNKVQDFVLAYLNSVSNNFDEDQVKTSIKEMRTSLDGFGLKHLTGANASGAYSPIDKIEITRYYGNAKSISTIWNPKIVDIQHDTLDYATSDAITWTLVLRYEAATYVEEETDARTTEQIQASNDLGDFPG